VNSNWNYSNQHCRLKQLLCFYSAILQLWQLVGSCTDITLARLNAIINLDLYNYDPQLSFVSAAIDICTCQYTTLTAHNAPKIVKVASYVMCPQTSYSTGVLS